MIEFFFVLYILLMFIFPLPTLSATLGAGTCYLIFRKHYLWKHQPRSGRKLLAVYWTGVLMNLSLSLALAVSMALMVYYVIFPNYFLMAFNALFSFSVSFRWFDYSHWLIRLYVNRTKQLPARSHQPGILAMLIGQRPHSGVGLGMMPSFIDVGYLTVKENRVHFAGLLIQETWSPAQFSELEKAGSEKIHMLPQPDRRHGGAAVYTLVLRDQFYPFRSRELRDRIIETLSSGKEQEASSFSEKALPRWRSAG
ncbi:membrane hypothetical protein [Nitrospina gracilis 3/211]|uniref:Uncharacterized protein n=1 Tax=Nitrospina gracilis (strain 3/211) TaxID=1266370 RepID=M1Z1G1_NITG3|nr:MULTISPECIES: hypothetical protein [Nitrospina]MCF8724645.1 hypothetical protein [Nitrospina sp. Nb-3]CCQ91827.1 membrane hypothetical protein [Nitrospina gracilis 3/211]